MMDPPNHLRIDQSTLNSGLKVELEEPLLRGEVLDAVGVEKDTVLIFLSQADFVPLEMGDTGERYL